MSLLRYHLLFLIALMLGWGWLPVALAAGDASVSSPETAKIVSPENVPGTTRINAEELIELMWATPELTLIDSRITSDRSEGFIEGSISLPNTETSCESLEAAIPDKSAPALFYCNGVKCGRSAKAAKISIDCGYNQVYWFRGGIEEWRQKKFPLQK
jgi:rhodanese-related sulfurtransferase